MRRPAAGPGSKQSPQRGLQLGGRAGIGLAVQGSEQGGLYPCRQDSLWVPLCRQSSQETSGARN